MLVAIQLQLSFVTSHLLTSRGFKVSEIPKIVELIAH
jgi:hypothetical protein